MSTAPPAPPAPPRRRVRPERRTRTDVVVAVVLALLVAAGVVLTWRTSPQVATVDTPAAAPIPAPPRADAVPAAFVEAWRAPSWATSVPVVAGPAVVTGDGGTVTGRDAVSGAPAWTYRRDRPLCAVAAGFANAQGGERLLALYRNGAGDWCSELTSLHPDLGTRADTSNPDALPGTQLVARGSYVLAPGPRYLEVWRSDLVRTLQYGAQVAPVQPGKQPRPDCEQASAALAVDHVGVIERCPGATVDRVTVLAPDGPDGADSPQVQWTTELDGGGAQIVALTTDRTAVALTGRLLVFDGAGAQDAAFPVTGPVTATGQPVVTADGDRYYWWTGSSVVALDARDLTPLWTAPDALGPPVEYAGALLMPVASGLRVLDPGTGVVRTTIPVDRGAAGLPVRLAAAGPVVLEQRGAEVVALRPA